MCKTVVPSNQFSSFAICFWWYLFLHFIGWWIEIKGYTAHLTLRLWCLIGSERCVHFGSIWSPKQIFFGYELRVLFPLLLNHIWQYDSFLKMNMTCLQGFKCWGKSLIMKASRCCMERWSVGDMISDCWPFMFSLGQEQCPVLVEPNVGVWAVPCKGLEHIGYWGSLSCGLCHHLLQCTSYCQSCANAIAFSNLPAFKILEMVHVRRHYGQTMVFHTNQERVKIKANSMQIIGGCIG